MLGNVFLVLYVTIEILSYSNEKVIGCYKFSEILKAAVDDSSNAAAIIPLL